MKKISKLLIGTNNKGKYKEIKDLLPKYIKTYSTSDFKLKSPREDGLTFKENSIIKSKHFSKKTRLICLADDSGLEIDLLDKSPGIYSARWGGKKGDFKKAINRVYKELSKKDKNWKNKNKDRIKNYNTKWNSENKQRKSELWKQWYDKNKEDVKKYQKKYGKKWRAENKENRKEWWKKYLKTEKGFINNKKAKIRYRRSDKGKITARHQSSKRRAIERKARVNLTEYEEGEMKQIYAHAVRVSNKLQIPFHVDHIVPLSKGGLHHPSNMQICPASWNMSKNNRNTERWLPNGM